MGISLINLISINNKLIEGIDYYYNDEGKVVFTEEFLRKRGKCCHSGCKHCPYGYKK